MKKAAIIFLITAFTGCTTNNYYTISDNTINEDENNTTPDTPSLQIEEPANCFIVSSSGTYKFACVKGNSSISVGNVENACVLWESYGTEKVPASGDLISHVEYNNGYITFKTNETFKKGNAVIAAEDASGTILWSWHIWLTDKPEEQVYANNAGTMMDRNLGATSAEPKNNGTLGLFYQWGRKDPFLGSCCFYDDIKALATMDIPNEYIESNSTTGTIEYTIQHPATWICDNENTNEWYWDTDWISDNTRWQSNKTIYDPCPAGWRVPDYDIWSKAGFHNDDNSVIFDQMSKGLRISNNGYDIFYPAAGCVFMDGQFVNNTGYEGLYWSVTTDENYPVSFSLYFDMEEEYLCEEGDDIRTYGQNIRCCKE